MDPPRWWQAHGPWFVVLEGSSGEPWRPAWLALLAGGEATMPLDDDPTAAGGARRRPRRAHPAAARSARC